MTKGGLLRSSPPFNILALYEAFYSVIYIIPCILVNVTRFFKNLPPYERLNDLLIDFVDLLPINRCIYPRNLKFILMDKAIVY